MRFPRILAVYSRDFPLEMKGGFINYFTQSLVGVIVKFDVLLPLTLFAVSSASLLLFSRFEERLEVFTSGQKLRTRDTVLLVAVMGVMVTIMVMMPGRIIQVLFLFAASSLLFLLSYLIVPKWPLALLLPALLILLYFYSWNLIFLDLFAILLVVSAILYIGRLFTWRTTLVYAALLTAVDILHVFGTRHMVEYAEKLTGLGLPMMIILPTLPYFGFVGLGLGDLLLSGLFSIQTARRWGKKQGLICCISIAATFLLGAFIVLNTERALPATIFVSLGWLISLGINNLLERRKNRM